MVFINIVVINIVILVIIKVINMHFPLSCSDPRDVFVVSFLSITNK